MLYGMTVNLKSRKYAVKKKELELANARVMLANKEKASF